MFTGLILEMGEITSIKKKGLVVILSLGSREIAAGAAIGDSIAVNGV